MMSKILLIYPPISVKERYSSDIGNSGGKQIPLGIYYLASYMRLKNYDVQVIDGEACKITTEEIIFKVKEFSPDYIGISSTTVAFHRALETAKAIKNTSISAPIILGGPHVTSNYEHAMSFSVFDYAVLCEGEITLWELCEALSHKTLLDAVEGIVYRSLNSEGGLIKTSPRKYIENLDILPFPAYDLIPDINLYNPPPSNYKKLPVISVITSRGCPSQCTFCDKNVFGNLYRKRSAENVFEEIKMLHERYNVQEICFSDDTFLLDKQRVRTLFNLLQEANIFVYWTCMSRINDVDKEYLQFLKVNGCWHISFGIESGDEAIIKLIKKNISLEKVRQVIIWCHELSIKTKGFFMVGHPLETKETIDKTINFALSLKLDDVILTINTPIPGSPQYSEVSQYGTLDESNWAEFNYWRPVFIPYGLSKDLLLEKHRNFYRMFYLRPRILLRYFISFFGRGGLRRLISIVKSSLFLLKKGKHEN
jgi:radical SAM superfamily enzyme YgiQ (UPF0313 family)